MAGMPGTKEAARARGLFRFRAAGVQEFQSDTTNGQGDPRVRRRVRGGLAAAVMPTMRILGDRLDGAFAETDADTAWPWPEPVLTYENALVPQALIVAGLRLGWVALVERGCAVLDWLVEVQSARRVPSRPWTIEVGCPGRQAKPVRPTADRCRDDGLGRRRGLCSHGPPPLPGCGGVGLRLVPGRQRPRNRDSGSGQRRLRRRPDPGRRERQPGRRIHPGVAHSPREDPGAASRTRRRGRTAPGGLARLVRL